MVGNDNAWFAPKRSGYGAGLPITWQGWAVVAAFVAVLIPLHYLHEMAGTGPKVAAFALFLASTAVFIRVVMTHTRGGWKWRWRGRT